MKARTFFAFRFEWSQKIAHLSPTVRLEIHEAAAYYAQNDELPEMSEEALEAFNEFLMPDFRRRKKAAEYRARAKARKEGRQEELMQETLPEPALPESEEDEAPVVATTADEQPAESPKPKLTYWQRRRLADKLRKAKAKARREAQK